MLRLTPETVSSRRRARRAAVKHMRASPALRTAKHGPVRARRGLWMVLANAFRRCAMGTNQISCFGIWRRGTRRQAIRSNRHGETRWLRSARNIAAPANISLSGFQKEFLS